MGWEPVCTLDYSGTMRAQQDAWHIHKPIINLMNPLRRAGNGCRSLRMQCIMRSAVQCKEQASAGKPTHTVC
jgi:hypothetical protein